MWYCAYSVTHFYDSCENMCALPNYHHQNGSMTRLPRFMVKWLSHETVVCVVWRTLSWVIVFNFCNFSNSRWDYPAWVTYGGSHKKVDMRAYLSNGEDAKWPLIVNSLWPSGAIWRQKYRPASAPSYYLNQCRFIIQGVLCHSPEVNF